MAQLGGDTDFTEEAGGFAGLQQLRTQHLDGHHSSVPQVIGAVHRGHAALSHLVFQAVPAGQGGTQRGDGLRQNASRVRREDRS